jgi:competence protein ComEA
MEPVNVPATPTKLWARNVQYVAVFLLGAAVAWLFGRFGGAWHSPHPTERERIIVVTAIDINQAGKSELLQLPGIGETLAEDILAERAQRGGFTSAEDLKSVRGLGPARIDALRPHVRFEKDGAATTSAKSTANRKAKDTATLVEVNVAPQSDLERLPGIGPVLAQRIIAAREKQPFRSVEDLRRVSGIGPKTLEKIRPYVVIRRPDEASLASDSR